MKAKFKYTEPTGLPYKEGDRLAEVVVHMRRNSDGKLHSFRDQLYWAPGDDAPSTYNWEDGNYSCDGNRASFFGDRGLNDDHVCSEGKYSVNLENPVTGKIFYREFQ